MLDLVIKNARAVLESGVCDVDISVHDGKIVGLTAPGSGLEAQQTTDAAGSYVIPGGVDPHIHAGWPLHFLGDDTAYTSAGPRDVSRAAIAGGTTSLIDFAPVASGTSPEAAVRDADQRYSESFCDFSFHIMLQGEFSDTCLDEVGRLLAGDLQSVKIFTTDVAPTRSNRQVRFGDIADLLPVVRDAGGVVAVHAEDDDIVMHNYRRAERTGETGFERSGEIHSALSEDLSFRRILRAAELMRTPVYLMHVSSERGVQALREWQGRGNAAYGETLHHYAHFTTEDYARPNGQIFHTFPSLKGESDVQALWNGLCDATLHTLATDSICTPLEMKVRGTRADDVTGGNVGVQTRLPVAYTESVVHRGMPIRTFVDIASTNAAKIFGLYPAKGVIAPGSDADLVILDTSTPRKLAAADLIESDYTPWEGYEVHAWPTQVFVRGDQLVRDSAFVGEEPSGRRAPRGQALAPVTSEPLSRFRTGPSLA